MISWDGISAALGARRTVIAASGAAASLMLAVGGLAVAEGVRPHPDAASAGRVMDVRYTVVRAAYTPPPVTEAARLDVLAGGFAQGVHPEVLSAEAALAWRSLEAEEAQRRDATLQALRTADAKLDRELRAQLAESRYSAPVLDAADGRAPESPEPAAPPAPAVG